MVDPHRVRGLIRALDNPPLDLDRFAIAFDGFLEVARFLVDRADAVEEDRERVAPLEATGRRRLTPGCVAAARGDPRELRQIASATR